LTILEIFMLQLSSRKTPSNAFKLFSSFAANWVSACSTLKFLRLYGQWTK
jgi:hypothetical protein